MVWSNPRLYTTRAERLPLHSAVEFQACGSLLHLSRAGIRSFYNHRAYNRSDIVNNQRCGTMRLKFILSFVMLNNTVGT